jgi:hypothetical protein
MFNARIRERAIYRDYYYYYSSSMYSLLPERNSSFERHCVTDFRRMRARFSPF